MSVRLLRFLFAPEIGRGPGRGRERSPAPARERARALGGVDLRGERRWRRLLERERRPRVPARRHAVGPRHGACGFGMTGLMAGPAGAQTIDPDIFAAGDNATRDLLGFLSDMDVARHAVLGDMLFIFNGGVLVLAGFLLLWAHRGGRRGYRPHRPLGLRGLGDRADRGRRRSDGSPSRRHERRTARRGRPGQPRRRFRGRGVDPLLGAGARPGRSHRAPAQGRCMALRHLPRAAGRDLLPCRQRQRAPHRRRPLYRR